MRWLSDAAPGIARIRRGRSFAYYSPNGSVITDEKTLQRVRQLAIPPAWTDVWISPKAKSHIQATGYDARGRKQYRYHPDWSAERAGEKFQRMYAFGRALKEIRSAVSRDLRRKELSKPRVVAACVSLLDRTGIRVGNEGYARANNTYGLTTLRRRHVRVEGSAVRLVFKGKGGKGHNLEMKDPRIARTIIRCSELRGTALLKYRGADGRTHRVTSGDINSYLRKVGRGNFTAKDFRTWVASVEAVRILMECPPPERRGEAQAALRVMFDAVAATLGNTPSICRKCYVHPLIVSSFVDGRLRDAIRRTHGEPAELSEAAFLRLLRSERTSRQIKIPGPGLFPA